LWSKTDDAVGSGDADNIEIDRNTNGSCTVGLSSISAPDTGTRTLRVRAKKEAAGGNARTIAADLLADGEGTPVGTLSAQTLTENYQTFEVTVTGTITDYSTLELVITAGGTVSGPGGNRRAVQVADVEFETPDAGVETQEATASGSNQSSGSTTGIEVGESAASGTNQSFGSATVGADEQEATASGSNTSAGSAIGVELGAGEASGANVSSGTAAGVEVGEATASGANVSAGSANGVEVGAVTASGTNDSVGNATAEDDEAQEATASGVNVSAGSSSGVEIGEAAASGMNMSSGTASSATQINQEVRGAWLVDGVHLRLGPIADGQVYQRDGNELIGVDP
jgi:hypothetical protein